MYLIGNSVCPGSFLGDRGATQDPAEAWQFETEEEATKAARKTSWRSRVRIVRR
jgi:hypothetical protein